jgi:crotonobetainyl-CoA:carnitine CoA-transferase CaiB-like acyl-CoA transferase
VDYAAGKEKLFPILGMESYLEDVRFESLKSARPYMKELVNAISEKFMTKMRDEWAEIFNQYDIVYERLVHYDEVSKDSQAIDNFYLEEVEFNTGAKVKMPKLPLQFSEYDVKGVTPAGAQGCNTAEILSEMGYAEEEILSLKERKIIKLSQSD